MSTTTLRRLENAGVATVWLCFAAIVVIGGGWLADHELPWRQELAGWACWLAVLLVGGGWCNYLAPKARW